MSVAGKIGGQEARAERGDSVQLFSSGFEWANYKIPNLTLTGVARGSSSIVRRTGSEAAAMSQDCGIGAGAAGLDQLLVCAIILAVVAVLRGALCAVLVCVMRRETPMELIFPSWEVLTPTCAAPSCHRLLFM